MSDIVNTWSKEYITVLGFNDSFRAKHYRDGKRPVRLCFQR